MQPDHEEAAKIYLLNRDEEVRKLLSGDEQVRASLKNHIRQFIEKLQADENFRKIFENIVVNGKDLLNTIGDSDDTFNQYLAVFNGDYRRYLLIGEQIKAEIKAESEYSLDDYLL